MHRIEPPLPRTPTPCYRHLFLRRRGGLTDNGIHLNLSLGLSNQPGPPHIEQVRAARFSFLLVAKPEDHTSLYL